MNITNGQPFAVSAELHATYRRFRTHSLMCAWCGRDLQVGDSARLVMTNTGEEITRGLSGNPFICATCDGPREEIFSRLRAALAEFEHPRFRWFRGSEYEDALATGEQREENRRAREDRYSEEAARP